jgi:hypothetical protein
LKVISTSLDKPDIVVLEDEEFKRVDFDKFKKLNTVFQVNIGWLKLYRFYIILIYMFHFRKKMEQLLLEMHRQLMMVLQL